MPRRVDHDERRNQITAALLRIASTRGLQAVTMREVAAEARMSVRLIQYYFTDKHTLLVAGLAELAARLDRRARERAATLGTALPPHTVLEVLLSAIIPTDQSSRLDQLAWTAYYAAALTDDTLMATGTTYPTALEDFLTTQLVSAQAAGDVDSDRDPRTEAVTLLALANGLTASILGGQHTPEAALTTLTYQLDQLFPARPSPHPAHLPG